MSRLGRTAILALLFAVSGTAARADGQPWAAGVYIGPATTKFFGAVVTSFEYKPTGVMVGVVLDRKLLYLGYDVYLGGEVQVTQYFFGHNDTTFAGGLGFICDDFLGVRRSSFSFYDGPSFALDPPYTSIGYRDIVYQAQRHKFLNNVSVQYAIGLPGLNNWDGIVRLYHRSGAFGLYSDGDDDGMAVGLGVRYRF